MSHRVILFSNVGACALASLAVIILILDPPSLR